VSAASDGDAHTTLPSTYTAVRARALDLRRFEPVWRRHARARHKPKRHKRLDGGVGRHAAQRQWRVVVVERRRCAAAAAR
jgi:hypothetical protein